VAAMLTPRVFCLQRDSWRFRVTCAERKKSQRLELQIGVVRNGITVFLGDPAPLDLRRTILLTTRRTIGCTICFEI
jgi:hypothetical protein